MIFNAFWSRRIFEDFLIGPLWAQNPAKSCEREQNAEKGAQEPSKIKIFLWKTAFFSALLLCSPPPATSVPLGSHW